MGEEGDNGKCAGAHSRSGTKLRIRKHMTSLRIRKHMTPLRLMNKIGGARVSLLHIPYKNGNGDDDEATFNQH